MTAPDDPPVARGEFLTPPLDNRWGGAISDGAILLCSADD